MIYNRVSLFSRFRKLFEKKQIKCIFKIYESKFKRVELLDLVFMTHLHKVIDDYYKHMFKNLKNGPEKRTKILQNILNLNQFTS